MKSLKAITLSLFFIVSATVEATERMEFYNGTRELGMGGARIAVVNDETGLLVNPAGLGKLRDYFFTVADPELEVGADTQSLIGSDVTAFRDPQEVLELLEPKRDKRLHQRLQVFPSMVFPNFGLGVYARFNTDAEVTTTPDRYYYDYESYVAGVLGFNFRLFDGRIKFGFNVRYANKVVIDSDHATNATGLTLKNLAKEGVGVASDVGLILTAPVVLLPTLAVVYRDAGNTQWDVNDGMYYDTAERPEKTLATLDAAIAFFPIFGKRQRMTFTGEMRDVLTAYDAEDEKEDVMRRVHAGIEYNIADTLFIRAGMNQRYWTAGLEFAVLNYQLQFATYGEEIGTADETREDRRYNGKFSWRF